MVVAPSHYGRFPTPPSVGELYSFPSFPSFFFENPNIPIRFLFFFSVLLTQPCFLHVPVSIDSNVVSRRGRQNLLPFCPSLPFLSPDSPTAKKNPKFFVFLCPLDFFLLAFLQVHLFFFFPFRPFVRIASLSLFFFFPSPPVCFPSIRTNYSPLGGGAKTASISVTLCLFAI